jgi:hypothetical protein
MPEICRFYGIIVAIFYSEHNPPHFHALYGGHKASIGIRDLSIIDGSLPPRALGLVMEWAAMHQSELMSCWERAMSSQQPGKIAPLP